MYMFKSIHRREHSNFCVCSSLCLRIVKMSSPNLNVLTLCGSVLTYSSGFLFAFEERTHLQGGGVRAILQVRTHTHISLMVPCRVILWDVLMLLWCILGQDLDVLYRQHSGIWAHPGENMAAVQSIHPTRA
jgi:hypothetical protein